MIFGFGGRGGGLGIRSVVFDGFPYTCINIMQGLITGRMLENQFPNPRLKDRLSPIWFYTNSPHSWKLEVGVFFHDKEIKAKIGLSHWSDVLEEYYTNVALSKSLVPADLNKRSCNCKNEKGENIIVEKATRSERTRHHWVQITALGQTGKTLSCENLFF